MRNVFKITVLALFGGFAPSPASAATAQVTYHGRLLKPDNTPVISSLVKFKIQVRTPGLENCLLFQETHQRDMSLSDGAFAITLNDGTASVVNTEAFAFERIFQNRGTFSFAGGRCSIGSSYTPGVADGRKLIVSFDDGTTGGWEDIPAQTINQVPLAVDSMTVGGFKGAELFRVVDGSGNPVAITPWTSTDYTNLLSIVSSGNTSGSSAGFTGSLAGDVSGAQSATVVGKIQGRPVAATAPSTGQVLKWNGSTWAPAAETGSGSGSELTTASNVGSAGVGVFKQISSFDLQFKKINAASSALQLTDDAGNDKIDIGVNAELDALANLNAAGFVKRGAGSSYSSVGSIGLGDLNIGGALTNNTGLLVTDGTALQNKACSPNEVLKWLSPSGWTCAAETDPRLTLSTTNALGKWNGSAVVDSGVFEIGGNVGVGTTSPLGILDVTSTTSGFLPPRMTTAQRDAIASPPTGSMIFNTTTGLLEIHSGSSWVPSGQSIPNGAVMAFNSSSCPTGWTTYASAQDKVIVGSGSSYSLGATGGSNTATSSSTGAHDHGAATGSTAISIAQMPSHNHGGATTGGANLTHSHGVSDPGHAHDAGSHPSGWEAGGYGLIGNPGFSDRVMVQDAYGFGTAAAATGIWIQNSGALSHDHGISAQGGGGGHTHTISSDGNHAHTVDVRQPYIALLYCQYAGGTVGVTPPNLTVVGGVNITAPADGQALVYNSTSGKWENQSVTGVLGYTPVNKTGDTMTGPLNLPSNGLVVGTSQLVVSGSNVGIGTTSPRAGLDVSTGAFVSKAATAVSIATVDFAGGNLQYTASNCGTFALHNLKDGGSYMFAVQGAASTTCVFNAYSDAGTTALTVHMPPDHAATTASKHTIYNLAVMGTHVYVAWTPGY